MRACVCEVVLIIVLVPRWLVIQLSVMYLSHTCYSHDNDCFAEDVYTYSPTFSFCKASVVAAMMCLCTICTMLAPIMDLGLSLTSCLCSLRLTTFSCQTNEHARKQKAEEKKGGGGAVMVMKKAEWEGDCEIPGRILVREESAKELKKKGEWSEKMSVYTVSHQPLCFYYNGQKNKLSHCMENDWPVYHRGERLHHPEKRERKKTPKHIMMNINTVGLYREWACFNERVKRFIIVNSSTVLWAIMSELTKTL